MHNNHPKNSVVVVCYNQESLISRTLDSILCQKDFVFEIIVADDCSTDTTWDIIVKYQSEFPELIKPFRNHTNLGIFENFANAIIKSTGDLTWYIAGDDMFMYGVFEQACSVVDEHNIDFKNDAFSIYFDFKEVHTNGKEIIVKNNLVELYDAVGLKIRQLIANRSVCFSKKVLEKFYPVRKDIGILADGLLDLQVQLFSDKNYYKSFIGSAYFTNIGVSTKTKKDEIMKSAICVAKELPIALEPISKANLKWVHYWRDKTILTYFPSFGNFIDYLSNFHYIFYKYYGLSFFRRECLFFVISLLRVVYNKFFKKHK